LIIRVRWKPFWGTSEEGIVSLTPIDIHIIGIASDTVLSQFKKPHHWY
jgi:hypothetical protein